MDTESVHCDQYVRAHSLSTCPFLLVVLLQIIELLADPSTESPVVPAIAQQILKSPDEFYETARKHTAAHAQPVAMQ